MLDAENVKKIVSDAVAANTMPDAVRRVIADPDVTSEGEAALRITIIITPEAVDQLAAGRAADVLTQIWDRFDEAGEERFPILQYATEAELEQIDRSES